MATAAKTAASTEFFDAIREDWWICPCGNNPAADGLRLARVDGTPDDDISEKDWNRHRTLTCWRCGRYGRATQLAEGKVPVRGTIDPHLLDRCAMEAYPVPEVIAAVRAEVYRVHEAFVAEGNRLLRMTPTTPVMEFRNQQLLANEMTSAHCEKLVSDLLAAGELLKALRRVQPS
jgi:hypothetical protein